MSARSALQDLKGRFYRSFYRKEQRLRLDRGIVSLTFDDVPHSALENAFPLLERAGQKVTLYVAGSVAQPDAATNNERFISLNEAKRLHQLGHQIGCHTFTHRRPRPGTDEAYVNDAIRNRDLLQKEIGGDAGRHFSYPFGALTLGIKRRLRWEYDSLRSARRGVNVGSVDLAHILADRLYSRSLDREYIVSQLTTAQERRGWVVFYTHGVSNPAPDYGLSVSDFEWVLSRLQASRCDLLTVAKACERIQQ